MSEEMKELSAEVQQKAEMEPDVAGGLLVSAVGDLLSKQQLDYLRDLVNHEINFSEKELQPEERASMLAFLNPLYRNLTLAMEGAAYRKFLVVVCEEYVRDTQIAASNKSDPSETDGWHNSSGEHVLGQFDAESASEAIKRAALVCEISEEVLGAYELGGIGTRMAAVLV